MPNKLFFSTEFKYEVIAALHNVKLQVRNSDKNFDYKLFKLSTLRCGNRICLCRAKGLTEYLTCTASFRLEIP